MDPEVARCIEENIALVRFAMHRYGFATCPESEFQERESDGLAALVRLAQSFDASLGFKFSTYAVGGIRGEISLGILRRQDLSGKRRATGKPIMALSLDAPRTTDEGSGTLGDLVSDLPDPGLAGTDEAMDAPTVRAAIAALPERERIVAVGIAKGRSLQEIADKLNVSEGRVSQIWHQNVQPFLARRLAGLE